MRHELHDVETEADVGSPPDHRHLEARMPESRKATLARGAVLFASVGAVMGAVTLAAGSFEPALPVASPHADPSPTPSPSPAKKPPKIPCATPSTTGAVSSKGQAANTAGAKGGAWTGVLERVFVKTNTNGSVASTPSQETVVSTSGTSPVTVHIPVSGPVTAKLRRFGRGTPEANGQADVTLHPDGTTAQQLITSFHHPLPVTVAVTYRLNGKPISPSQIGGKSGTVQVTYKLTNVSAKRISACFEGFNGQHQHITLSTPIPIIASVSLTVPKQATSFTAPGSSLSPTSPTVFVLWGASLFEPLGPLTQSFTFTMKTTNATPENQRIFRGCSNDMPKMISTATDSITRCRSTK